MTIGKKKSLKNLPGTFHVSFYNLKYIFRENTTELGTILTIVAEDTQNIRYKFTVSKYKVEIYSLKI